MPPRQPTPTTAAGPSTPAPSQSLRSHTKANRTLTARLLSPSNPDWSFPTFFAAFKTQSHYARNTQPHNVRSSAQTSYLAHLERLAKNPRTTDRANREIAKFKTQIPHGGKGDVTIINNTHIESQIVDNSTHVHHDNSTHHTNTNSGNVGTHIAALTAANLALHHPPTSTTAPAQPPPVTIPSSSSSSSVPDTQVPSTPSRAASEVSTVILPSSSRLQLTAHQQLSIDATLSLPHPPGSPTEFAFDPASIPPSMHPLLERQREQFQSVIRGYQDELAKWVARDRWSAARIRELEGQVAAQRVQMERVGRVRELMGEMRKLREEGFLLEPGEEEEEENEDEGLGGNL